MKIFSDRKCLFSLFLFVLVFLTTGCDEILRKWTRDIHRNPQELTVLVFPPIPVDEQLEDAELMKSLHFAKRVRDGIMRGVEHFNKHSSETTINPVYYTHPDKVIGFYDELLTVKKENQRRVCQSWLDRLNRADYRWNASCVVFGFFMGKSEYASSVRVRFVYYDSKMRQMYFETAVISKDGRQMQGQLQEAMVSLLKKACGE